MLRIEVLTLFPELFAPFTQHGLVSRAVKERIVDIQATPLRNYAINTHGQVDDSPFGGGSGMVLRPDAADAALRDAKLRHPKAKTILFTPRGTPLTQPRLRALAEELHQSEQGLILLCSRYEGVDERVVDQHVDEEICIGDFIAMGGESPALLFLEALIRLLPGVLNNTESLVHESFESGLIEHPHYTKPQEYLSRTVPAELLSGHHQQIEQWRKTQSVESTIDRRPDLVRGPIQTRGEFSVALIHAPVVGKEGETITSSITNIDLHDIARSARTYGVAPFYCVHPVRTLRRLAQNITEHWQTGFGATYNPNRSEALQFIKLVPSFDDVMIDIESRLGVLPKVITTSAKTSDKSISFGRARQLLLQSPEPHIMLLGTGWGLAPEILERADYHLEPVIGATGYNHLSVRSPAAIMFDKILGFRDEPELTTTHPIFATSTQRN